MSNIPTNTHRNTVPGFSGLQLSNSAKPVVREREGEILTCIDEGRILQTHQDRRSHPPGPLRCPPGRLEATIWEIKIIFDFKYQQPGPLYWVNIPILLGTDMSGHVAMSTGWGNSRISMTFNVKYKYYRDVPNISCSIMAVACISLHCNILCPSKYSSKYLYNIIIVHLDVK